MRISREHFGHRSGSASYAFLINSRHFLEGMRRGSWAETSITSTASPSVCTSSSACHSGTDPPGENDPRSMTRQPFPDYYTEPVMAFSAT
jgi:hypothetical protein